jgi:hypothetical protein
LSFSFSGTIGSHNTPEAWCHINQSDLILWLTYSPISPFFRASITSNEKYFS